MKASCQRVLDLLLEGPQSTGDFANKFCPRAAARVCELRKMGYQIESHRIRRNAFLFTLLSEPDDLAVGGAVPPVPCSPPEPVAVDREAEPVEQQLFDTIDIPRPGHLDPDQEWAA